MMEIVGAIIFAAIALLLLAAAWLHHLHLKEQSMNVFDDLKALATEFVAAVEELKGLDVAGFVEKVKADAAAVAATAETELEHALPDLQAGVAGVRSFLDAVKSQIAPPAPVAAVTEPAPAEQPAS